MHEVTARQVAAVLRNLGIQPGDNLLVHSAIQFLGRPVGGAGLYLQALQETTGASGTVAVPAFNFAFARGEDFDPGQTPSQGMGVFSEYVRCQPLARRTPHPLQSLAALGPLAEDLAARDTPCAFDPGSAFERMLELDFKLLLLGADIQAVSMVHYCEQRAGVPYRYWKDFRGRVRTSQGWEERTYRMYVRDLQIDPQLRLRPIQEGLQAQGLWGALPLNYGQVAVCRLVDFVSTTGDILSKDPWGLVGNRHAAQQRYLERGTQVVERSSLKDPDS